MAAIGQAVFGRHHWYGFRWLTWLAASGVVVSLVGLGVLGRKPIAGAIAASFYVWVCFYHYGYGAGFAMNGEQMVAPLLCGAALFTALALRRVPASADPRAAALAGALAAAAGWTKITMMVAVLPLALWVVTVALVHRGDAARSIVRALAALIAGWLVPTLAVPLVYASAGQLDELIYRFFTYNSQIYMGVYSDTPVWPEIGKWLVGDPLAAHLWLGCAGWLAGYAGYLLAMRQQGELRAALARTSMIGATALLAGLAFATGIAQMRFWSHHFITAMPWAGLLVGFVVQAGLDLVRGRLHTVLSVVIAALLIATLDATVGQNARLRELQRGAGAYRPAGKDPMCAAIHRYAAPDEPIFVWGFDGDLHVSCARRPATRFVYTTLVAGIVPPFWKVRKDEYIARDAPALTLRDLRREKPPLILDMPEKLHGVRMEDVRELKRLLKKQYCKIGKVEGDYGRSATFYVRKDSGHCGKAATSSK
jgi:hypothetical protein